jgi:hypothetical protein
LSQSAIDHLLKSVLETSRSTQERLDLVPFGSQPEAAPRSPFAAFSASISAMTKLCIFVGMTVGGYAAGALAEPLGFWWSFIASGIGSAVGVILGWKFARRLDR